MTVETAPLGEVATIERATVQPDSIPDGETYVGLENITTEGSFSEVEKVAAGELKSGKFRFDDGHLLYGKLRPYLSKIAAPSFSGVCSTDILPLRAGPRVDRKYLLHFLRTPEMVGHASKLATGANLPRLSPKALAAFSIPLPPIEEQRRIAAVLDAADALRAKRRQAIAELDSLTQAIFIDMFAGRESAQVTMQEIAEFKYGTSEKSARSGVTTLRIPNVIAGQVDYDDVKRVPVSESDLERLKLDDGDVLFVRSNGNPDNVGRCAAFSRRIADRQGFTGPVVYASYLIRARLRRATVEPVFLTTFLNGVIGRRSLRAAAKTSAGQYNINTKGLGSIPIPLPPIGRQVVFRERATRVDQHRAAHEVQMGQLDQFFASLQQRAFRGEL